MIIAAVVVIIVLILISYMLYSNRNLYCTIQNNKKSHDTSNSPIALMSSNLIIEPAKLTQLNNETKEQYKHVINTIVNFNRPTKSENEIIYKKISDFTKEELTDANISDIYNQMMPVIDNKLSKQQLDGLINELDEPHQVIYTNKNDFEIIDG